MVNKFLKLIRDNKFIDNTEIIEDLLDDNYTVMSNTAHTGSSVILDMMEVFLSREYTAIDVFENFKICQWDKVNNHLNKYVVIKLDFSDFNAVNYEAAIDYFKEKMAVIYLKYNECFILDKIEKEPSRTKKWMLFIKKEIDERALAYSLRNVICELRYLRLDERYYNALLIDNLVRVETVSRKYDYYDQMKKFLNEFIVSDVYKLVDVFLQIGSEENNRAKAIDYWLYDHYLSYSYFSISDRDIKHTALYDKLLYDENYYGNEDDYSDKYECCLLKYEELIKEQEIMIEKATIWHNNYLIEQEKKMQERYLKELRADFPRISNNLGIRKIPDFPKNEKYHEFNRLLTEIYKSNPKNDDDVYMYFQHMDRDIPTDLMRDKEEYSKMLESFSSCWEITPNISSYWVQIECCKDGSHNIAGLGMIKAYLSINTPKIKDIFINFINHLLIYAKKSFGIKASRYLRADTICVWIQLEDLKVLEEACVPYEKNIGRELHFMPYKGNIAISKDLLSDISYNYVVANIINEYFKVIKNVEEIDVFEMYNMFIHLWNRELPYKDSMFVGMSAFTFMVILDSFEAILSQKDLPYNSALFCQDYDILDALDRSKCWGDVRLRKLK